MVKSNFLEAGIIVNTHGVHGEIRISPWTDTPAFLASLKTIYIDGEPRKITSSRVHKHFLLVALDGVDSFESAIGLKNKIIYISRDDVKLEHGRHFISDLIGLDALDAETNSKIGTVSDIMSYPANDIYVIKADNTSDILIPAVPEFVKEINVEAGYISFRIIKGMV